MTKNVCYKIINPARVETPNHQSTGLIIRDYDLPNVLFFPLLLNLRLGALMHRQVA